MASRPRRLNLLLSVMIALLGVASAPGIAAACSGAANPIAAKACCKSMPAKDCQCCDPVPSGSSTPRVDLSLASFRVAPALGTPLLIAAPEHCGCRLEAPSNPAQRPDPRTPEGQRPTSGPDPTVFVLAAEPPIALPAHFCAALPGLRQGRSPLYLRTSRLLI